MASGCALIVIGNEILSGKVTDGNSPWLLKQLHDLGQTTRSVRVIPDGVPIIAEAVREAAATHEHVFTSGGVGPTLDDLTFDGVAEAFGMEVVLEPRLEAVIRHHLGERTNENHLRMARVPAGADLMWPEEVTWPVVRVRNVIVLPGEPTFFRSKFLAIREHFRTTPFTVHRLWVDLEEGALAPYLDDLHQDVPEVEIGSYPTFGEPEWKVMITLESKDESVAARARDLLLERLPEGVIVRRG